MLYAIFICCVIILNREGLVQKLKIWQKAIEKHLVMYINRSYFMTFSLVIRYGSKVKTAAIALWK